MMPRARSPSNDSMRRLGSFLLLFGICLLAFYLRFSLRFDYEYVFFGDPATSNPDADAITFNIHSLNLVEGRGFGDYLKEFRSQNYVPPGHPLFVGFFYFFLGNKPLLISWMVAFLGSLVPLFAYFWTREMWGRAAGYLAAFFVAIYEPYTRIGFTLMSEPTVIFTTAIALWLGTRLIRAPSFRGAIWAGLFFGFSALVRPSAFAFLWGMAPWLLIIRSISFRRRAAILLVFLAAAFALPACWMVRNAVVHGKPVFLYTSISARQAWNGAHPDSIPEYYSRTMWHRTLWEDPWASEIQMVERLQKETQAFIRADRLRYFFACLWRMHLIMTMDCEDEHLVKWSYGGLALAQTLTLFVLAVIGLFRAGRVRSVWERDGIRSEVPGYVWSGMIVTSLLFAAIGMGVYGASDRYRWPLEYALFPLAALAVYSIFNFARVDLFSRWELRCRIGPTPGWMVVLKRVGGGLLACLVAVYLAGLVHAHFHPERSADNCSRQNVKEVLDAINACGLAQEFGKQDPRWLSFENVFKQQALNFGRVTTDNGDIVVWWGRIVYPFYREDGRLKEGYIVLNPKTGDFGGARLFFSVARHSDFGLSGIKDGDIVTLIGRISYGDRALARPDLEVYGALPGRFDLPE